MSVAATFILGLFAGSLAIEGAVLVPFWRTLLPEEFFAMHKRFGPRLFQYFAPLTTLAVAVPSAAALIERHEPHARLRWIAAVLAIVALSSFPLFFAKANNAFEHRSVSDDELPKALGRWAAVHGARTAVTLLAFLASALAL